MNLPTERSLLEISGNLCSDRWRNWKKKNSKWPRLSLDQCSGSKEGRVRSAERSREITEIQNESRSTLTTRCIGRISEILKGRKSFSSATDVQRNEVGQLLKSWTNRWDARLAATPPSPSPGDIVALVNATNAFAVPTRLALNRVFRFFSPLLSLFFPLPFWTG